MSGGNGRKSHRRLLKAVAITGPKQRPLRFRWAVKNLQLLTSALFPPNVFGSLCDSIRPMRCFECCSNSPVAGRDEEAGGRGGSPKEQAWMKSAPLGLSDKPQAQRDLNLPPATEPPPALVGTQDQLVIPAQWPCCIPN